MKRQRLFVDLIAIVLVAGCAGPISNAPGSGSDGSTVPAAADITGTWRGSYWQLGANYYADDANCVLRIKADSTFTATCTKSSYGANNLAQSSTFAGRVIVKDNRIVLEDGTGHWHWITLKRGSGTLYGVTRDPTVENTIEMQFRHAPTAEAERKSQ